MPDFLKHLLQYSRHREVLRVCLPLVISLSATTVMEFTDRVFLANYSIDAISAALPAGITSYLFIAFFGGVGGYAGVFIAQYTGRGNPQKIGVVLWQGIYFTLASGLILWLLAVFATKPIFSLAGHAERSPAARRDLFFHSLQGLRAPRGDGNAVYLFYRQGTHQTGNGHYLSWRFYQYSSGLCPDFWSMGPAAAWHRGGSHRHGGGLGY